MPLYEYVCQNCGKTFDVLRSFKDADSSISCVACQSNDTKRQLSTCYSHSSGGNSSAASGGGCGGCSGGSCGSCHH